MSLHFLIFMHNFFIFLVGSKYSQIFLLAYSRRNKGNLVKTLRSLVIALFPRHSVEEFNSSLYYCYNKKNMPFFNFIYVMYPACTRVSRGNLVLRTLSSCTFNFSFRRYEWRNSTPRYRARKWQYKIFHFLK